MMEARAVTLQPSKSRLVYLRDGVVDNVISEDRHAL